MRKQNFYMIFLLLSYPLASVSKNWKDMKKKLNTKEFNTTKKELKKANPKMTVLVYLRYPNYMEWAKDLPKVRRKKLNEILTANYAILEKSISKGKLKRIGKKKSPRGIVIESNYKDILKIKLPDVVDTVYVDKIKGYDLKTIRIEPAFFAVKARFLIQVEGKEKGKQSYEDRIMLVRATSFDDAEKRASLNYDAYADPYLNPFGQFVRWKFEKVIDIYETFIDHVDDLLDVSGVEVFSVLKERKMKKSDIWEKQWED